MNIRKVLVYGTLKRGQRLHYILGHSKYLRQYKMYGYTLYSNGSYPLAIESSPKDYIKGELYRVDYHTWSRLCCIERPAGYRVVEKDEIWFFVYKDVEGCKRDYKHIGKVWK